MARKRKNLEGLRFGKLVVSELDHIKRQYGRYKAYWKCLCDCGNEKVVRADAMTRGVTNSCGCEMNKNRKLCKNGHPLVKRENGQRVCPICHRDACRKYQATDKGAVTKKQYREDHAEEEKVRKRAWERENPEKRKTARLRANKKLREEIKDSYIAQSSGLKIGQMPKEILDAYRLRLQLKREVRKWKQLRQLTT